MSLVVLLSLLAAEPGLATRPYMLEALEILEYPEKVSSAAAAIDHELKKETSKVGDDNSASTRVLIKNKAIGVLKLHDHHDWSGTVVGPYPPTIQANGDTVEFLHQGVAPQASDGSQGAVIYVGPNLRGEFDKCAWVLAWSTAFGSGQTNKIYVETGSQTEYLKGNIPWPRIKHELENSQSNRSYVNYDSDDCALTKASAVMVPSNGNNPVASADFYV